VRISVIVPVHNGATTLAACLHALNAGTRRPDELIVADDGSTDNSPALARKQGATVLRIGNTPLGPAAARNRAAEQATGDLLVFIDADVTVHPDTLARFEDVFTDPTVAAAFGSYDDTPPAPGTISRYKNLLHHYTHHRGNPEAATFWAGCGAVRREAFQAVGGFAEAYGTPSIEDIELGIRLRRAGHRIRLCPEIQCAHHKRWTLRSWLYTDIARRAVPWSRLIVSSGRLPRDLNLNPRERLSAGLACLILLSLLSAAFFPIGGMLTALFALSAWILLQADLLRFFRQRGGIHFALATVPLHLLYYLYASGAFLFVTLEHHARRAAPLLFFLCLFALTSNGRIANRDAYSQLQAATNLVSSGRLGAESPPGRQWTHAPDGLWYEWHDLGGLLMFTPAALVGKVTGDSSAAAPSLAARTAVATTYIVVSAFGAAALFGLLSLWTSRRNAFGLTLLFVLGTPYLPYAKACYDVQAAGVAIAGAMYFAVRWERARTFGDALVFSLCIAAACLLRWSLAPFLVLSLVLYLFVRRTRPSLSQAALCIAPVLIAVSASLLYNAVRTGAYLAPPSSGKAGAFSLLRNPIGEGIVGLLFSMNYGLLAAAPILTVLVLIPWTGRRWPPEAQRLFAAFGVGGLLYFLMMARLTIWGTFGWGPRYLVPLLPIVYLGVACIFLSGSSRLRRGLAVLAAVSVAANIAPTLVNWPLALSPHPEAFLKPGIAPHRQRILWNAIAEGLRGVPLPVPDTIQNDPLRSTQAYFPDLWLAYGIRSGGEKAAASVLAGLLLLAGAVVSGRRTIQSENNHVIAPYREREE
jgi:GT2 family glycosyltransferase